jgi:heavy metal sensor kinase
MKPTPKIKLDRLPIKVRLTLWYLLLAGLVVLLFGTYQYVQFKRSLYSSVDKSLQISLSQALSNIDIANGVPAFQNTENLPTASRTLLQSEFTIRILTVQGNVLESIGDKVLTASPDTLAAGYLTIRSEDLYRVLTQPIQSADGQVIGWLQAVQSLELVEETLGKMRVQLLLVLPVILLLTGLGGIFLANRTLHPIDQITRTAAEIGAGDLSHRISYQGPQDEIGRLAQTFDNMLSRLEAAFKRERRFTGDAAHELRTPLTVLRGQLDVTLSKSRKKSDYKSTLQALGGQVDRLIRLSNALLFLSRSDQKQLSWEPEPINLADLLDPIVEQILPLANERKLTVRINIPPGLLVYGDADHLIRLFLNLLDNAVKYTPEEGNIVLDAEEVSSGVRIEVSNSGEGIPQEHIQHLFERFYRVDYDRSSVTGGTGLGLAIAREIVLLHGGQISVESDIGKGTTFIVILPAQRQLLSSENC